MLLFPCNYFLSVAIVSVVVKADVIIDCVVVGDGVFKTIVDVVDSVVYITVIVIVL